MPLLPHEDSVDMSDDDGLEGSFHDASAQSSAVGEHLLTAVERLVDDRGNLIAQVENAKYDLLPEADDQEWAGLERVAGRLIAVYSTRSAVAGGIGAVPAVFPGGGTVVSLVGGSLVDMTLMLKHEVELALCLTHLYGYDIQLEHERWVAYALAAVNTYEASGGRSFVRDLADAQIEALSKYTPRQLTKLVATIMGRIALTSISRRFLRLVPFVGIVVGASANKVLTTAVGWRCAEALARRRHSDDGGSVVEATFE